MFVLVEQDLPDSLTHPGVWLRFTTVPDQEFGRALGELRNTDFWYVCQLAAPSEDEVAEVLEVLA